LSHHGNRCEALAHGDGGVGGDGPGSEPGSKSGSVAVVDGYAVRAADCPGTLVVTTVDASDSTSAEVNQGEAAHVAAGAPLPAGADVVVPASGCDPLQCPWGPAVYIPGEVEVVGTMQILPAKSLTRIFTSHLELISRREISAIP
jgi:hypothetical protein